MSEVGQDIAAVATPTVGELLRDGRQRLNLDAADVARQLRLGLRQVEALEANDFAALPGNTIVRGFIRNYAKLLQADPAVFLTAYEASLPTADAPKISATAENIDISPRRSRRWLAYLLGGLALVVGAPVAIYALLHDDAPEAPPVHATAPPAHVPAAAGQAAVSVPMPALQPVLTVPVEGQAPPASAEMMPQAPSAPAIVAEPIKEAVGNASILLAFEEDAWVEIRDRSGRKVFSQLGRKGASEPVSGEPPFSLVVGNAAKVRLIYKGKPVDLQPYIKVNVARLTLE